MRVVKAKYPVTFKINIHWKKRQQGCFNICSVFRDKQLLAAILIFLFINTNAQNKDEVLPHIQIVKYNNPGEIVDLGVGLWAQPLPMDFDKDGKMDLVVSCSGTPYNGIYFFKNSSGGKMPVFNPGIRLADGLRNAQISYVKGTPRITVPGAAIKNFSKSFGKETDNLFNVDSVIHRFKKIRANQWKLVDYDNDGEVDIVVGIGDWSEYGWDNAFDSKGNWTNGPLHGYVYLLENNNGHYINKGKIKTTDGFPIDVYGAPSPNFADFDGDGDLDLICGEFLDKLTWFENTGSRDKPVYAKGRYLTNSSGVISMNLCMINPVAVDWDGDSDIDLIVGQEDGRVAFMDNIGKVKDHMPLFKSPVFFKQKADDLKFGVLSTPFSVDWDSDGDEDIISGNSAGSIAFIKNLGGYPPKWAPPELLEVQGKPIHIQAGNNGSIQGPAEAKWGYTTLSVADWDGDGLKDIIVNSIWGKVEWYKNTGTTNNPKLSGPMPVKVDWPVKIPKPEWNWWNPHKNELVTEWRTTPYAIDWNKDGLMDLITLDHEGYLSFFERFKKNKELMLKPGKRIFNGSEVSGYNTNNKVTGSLPGILQLNTQKFGGSGRRKLCFADWDQDGKSDLLVNSQNVSFFKNMGDGSDYVTFKDEGILAQDKLAGHTTSPTTADWNKDGVPDLLIGAEDGHFYYLINQRP
jgi:hypothetical protein